MIGERDLVSVYVHTPFCRSKCGYCHFYSLATRSEKPFDAFMESLQKEWELYRPLAQGKRLASLYLGGGTPSLLGPERVYKIIQWITATFTPPPEPSFLEITLEVNPEKVSRSLMEGFAQAGVNRVSLGVQSFDDKLLQALGRRHDSRQAVEAIEAIVQAGIVNLSIDLMYELPGQTLDHWKATLIQASTQPLQHLSLYNLTLEPDTPFYRRQEKLRPLLPDDDTGAEMYRLAIEHLQERGFAQYELSAFCKEGRFSHHNVGYWTARPFLGLGPSAFSYWEGKRYANVSDLQEWHRLLSEAHKPVAFEEELDPASRRRELLSLRLRLLEGVSLTPFQQQYGPLEQETWDCLSKYLALELLKLEGNRLALTSRGLLFYDEIAIDLI